MFLDFGLEAMALGKEAAEFAGQTLHLFLKGFAVALLLGDANIAARSEDVVLLGDVVERTNGTIAFLVSKRSVAILVEGLCNAVDFLFGDFAKGAGYHRAHVAGIDEEDLTRLWLLTIEEPKANGNACGVEQLAGKRHDALHKVGLQDVLANLSFATRLAAERTVGKHHSDASCGGKVTNHVLQPSKVGVALWGHSEAPTHIVLQAVGSPVLHVEGWIGHNEVGLQRGVLVVEEGVGVAVAQIGLDATNGEVHHRHLACVGVDFLTKDAEVLDVALMVTHKVGTLDKHAA